MLEFAAFVCVKSNCMSSSSGPFVREIRSFEDITFGKLSGAFFTFYTLLID